MGRASKAPARKVGRPAGRTGPPPLAELSRDQLSVFLYVSLLPEETRVLVKELGLTSPGFRTEALGDVERCDLIADEIRAAPPAAAAVQRTLEAALKQAPMPGEPLTPAGALEMLWMCAGDSPLALALWRVLSDRDGRVRDAARPVLDWLAKEHYGPRPEAGEGAPAEPPAGREGADPGGRLRALEGELARAAERLEEARRRSEAQREKLQSMLREARAREAQAVGEAARAREAGEAARQELARAEAARAAALSTDAAQEAQRARAAARDLEGRAASLEARLERARERERELEERLAQAERAAPAPAPAAPPPEQGSDPEEEVSTWLMPVYTQEFYDSLEGWDRRIQRAAFKQAQLLAADHRHPSLRALPLEGLPGYYRVRVATDVRLLYRRGERQNTVEILSLIDREDLDRYIKQAKTRGQAGQPSRR